MFTNSQRSVLYCSRCVELTVQSVTKFQKLRVSLLCILLLISYGRYCNNLMISTEENFYLKTEKKISDAVHK